MNLLLDGGGLEIVSLVEVATDPSIGIEADSDALQRVERAHAVVTAALAREDPVYGLTTGLGARVGERLDPDQAALFSRQTLRGRAHAVGSAMPQALVRAALVVRVNTLLRGAAGASPGLVLYLLDCLRKNLIPVVGEIGSIGASDLCLGATMGLALTGEGQIFDRNGAPGPADVVLKEADMEPLQLAARDGLALANHSSFSAAALALAVRRTQRILDACQCAAALSMQGFGANLSTLDPLALEMRPQAGQRQAADQLRALLAGSELLDTARARRLQDPLSIRNVVQTHGAALACLEFASIAARDEINGASDNPVIDAEAGQIISCGLYHTPLLTLAAQNLGQAMVHVAHTQLARIARLLDERFTGLPQFLAAPGVDGKTAMSNGFAPVLKVAEALVARLAQAAAPVAVWHSVNAAGAEDIQTHSLTAIQALDRVLEDAARLSAIELMVGAQAIDLRQRPGDTLQATGLIALHARLRERSPPLISDRPLGSDIETIAAAVGAGEFAVDTATASADKTTE